MMKIGIIRLINSRVHAVPGLITLILTLYLGKGGILLLLATALAITLFESFYQFLSTKSLTPYHLFLFAPLILLNYSSIDDFKIRIVCFLLLVYLLNIALTKSRINWRMNLYSLKPLTIWGLALLVFLTGTFIFYLQGTYLSGDEPHYIMISQSLVEDGDFDLKNNNADQTYFKYLPIKLSPHTIKHKGKHLSYHMPGLSFILLPFYFLFNILGNFIPANLYFRIVASIINAFFALSLFYLLKMQFPRKNISGFWLFFVGTFPFLFHSIHLYPEIPAAGLMIAGILFCFYDRKNYLFAGLVLAMIPWFHVKYYLPLAILGVVISYRLLKGRDFKNMCKFFIFPTLSFILLLVFCKTLYGSFSPANIFPKDNYFNLPLWMRIRALFAYLVDQRDGLLPYAPILFLAFMGFKKKLKNQWLFISIGVSYILFHAYTTVRGAYAPAGRPLIFVSWVFVLFVLNYFYSLNKNTLKYGFRLFVLFSFFILIWLFYYPQFIYQPVFSNTIDGSSGILSFMGSTQINLSLLFPSFLNSQGGMCFANYFWLILLGVVLLFFYWSHFRVVLRGNRPVAVSLIIFLILAFLMSFYPHTRLIEKNNFTKDRISFYNNSKNFVYLRQGNDFRAKGGVKYNLFFDLKRSTAKKVNFKFINLNAFRVIIRNSREILFDSRLNRRDKISLKLRDLQRLSIKGRPLAHIGLEIEVTDSNPFLFLQIFGDKSGILKDT
jgi:hypothetical protein